MFYSRGVKSGPIIFFTIYTTFPKCSRRVAAKGKAEARRLFPILTEYKSPFRRENVSYLEHPSATTDFFQLPRLVYLGRRGKIASVYAAR